MVHLHLQVKFKCLAQLSRLVPSQLSGLITCHSLLLCPWVLKGPNYLCSSLSLVYVLPLCPPDVPSKWNVLLLLLHFPTLFYLALRLILGALSSNPQAAVLTSAPWTSPYLQSVTWLAGFQHDRNIVLFIFVSIPPNAVLCTEQTFREY